MKVKKLYLGNDYRYVLQKTERKILLLWYYVLLPTKRFKIKEKKKKNRQRRRRQRVVFFRRFIIKRLLGKRTILFTMAQPFNVARERVKPKKGRDERLPPPVVVPTYKMLRASDEASSNVLPRHLGTLSLSVVQRVFVARLYLVLLRQKRGASKNQLFCEKVCLHFSHS